MKFWAGRTSAPASPTVGSSPTAARARSVIAATSADSFRSAAGANPSSCSSTPSRRCAGVTSVLWNCTASCCAAATASWDLTVNLSACIPVLGIN
jgi:hypothetical protein